MDTKTLVNGNYVAAANNALWNGREACGKTFVFKCIGRTNLGPELCSPFSIFVKIVDYYPTCTSTINLSTDAFFIIANLDAGRVKINYEPYLP